MYLDILKKDLKRKKTMNVILLIFVILASMFVSSSVNNILVVSGTLDNFFEKAEMTDYFVGVTGEGSDKQLSQLLDNTDGVTSYKIEPFTVIDNKNLKFNGEKLTGNEPIITPLSKSCINFFDENNNEITNISKGECYTLASVIDENNLKIGDTLEVTYNDKTVNLRIKGYLKDAYLGSSMMSMSRILVNDADFDYLCKNSDNTVNYTGYMGYINSTDIDGLEAELNSTNDVVLIFKGSASLVKMTYIMDTVIAFVLLIVSVCLILISFAVLRFTINFTLEEEFREIGVMKAIGIGNAKIRGLYLVKYFAISLVGAAIGFVLGIPFGTMLLQSVSRNMVMDINTNYILNAFCSFGVVLIVMLFCWLCTRKIKKFTPIDAVRSGTTGERFNKKSKLSLAKSHFKPIPFMAVNDILSSIKRYIVMILTFTIGFLLIVIVANTGNTLKDGNLLKTMCQKGSDAYISVEDFANYYSEDGKQKLEKKFEEYEKGLENNDMDGRCSIEIIYKLSIEKGDKIFNSTTYQGVGTDTADYSYLEGTAPQSTKEIAVTPLICEKIDAEIGDKVTITDMNGEHEYIITAIFQSMNNMGEGIRLHQDVEMNYMQASGTTSFQIDFDDNPNDTEINKRIEKLKEMYPDSTIQNADDYVDTMIGGISKTVDGVKLLIIPMVLLICMLVVVLMERSFITKEKGEIAILKAVGFRNGAISALHTLRIAFVMIISIIIGAVISTPLTGLTSGQVFKMMGAQQIEFAIKPLEVFVIYPIIMLAFTLLAVALTSLYTRKINASQISNIE